MLKKHQPILDFSGIILAMCHFGHSSSDLLYRGHDQTHVAFPGGARGVLYYHVDPSLPPISGSLRFRLCNVLEEFERGSDLQVGPGQPWSMSLCRIVRTKFGQPICKMLLDDGLIDQRLVTTIQGLSLTAKILDKRSLYHLQQPVIFSLLKRYLYLQLVPSRSSSPVLFCDLFYDQSLKCLPFQGNVCSARVISPLF